MLSAWVLVCGPCYGVAVASGAPSHGESAGQGVTRRASKGFTTGPRPTWVVSDRVVQVSADTLAKNEDLVDEILDDQIRVGTTVEHYRRRVQRVVTASGIQRAGEIEISVDPEYERLVLHELVLRRGGERIDALKHATIREAATESGRDQRIYDGSVSVIIVISDLRVGDIVDAAWTVVGQNPVFGGHFVSHLAFSTYHPVRHRRVRLLWPPSRSLAFRASDHAVPEPRITPAADGKTEYVWEQGDLAADPDERNEPSWFEFSMLTLSEFASWREVAAWAAPLYDTKETLGTALRSKIDKIASANASLEARALAALRFVQDDIRYLGMELGEHSHRPHLASGVFEQRFGDCKDKSTLLVTMLRRLGIDAHAALVDTDAGAHLSERAPSPGAFDHVIVWMRIAERDIWVDPTVSLQRGPLGSVPVPFGRALIAAEGTVDLVAIDAPVLSRPTTVTHETFRLEQNDAMLDVVTTYRDGNATDLRESLSGVSPEELGKDYLNFYANDYPEVESRAPVVVDDDEAHDVIVVRERYRLKNVVADNSFRARPHSILSSSLLKRPRVLLRTTPLAVAHPSYIRHEIEVLGASFDPPEDVTLHDRTLTFTARSEALHEGASLAFELRTHRDSVPPAEVAAHLKTVDAILDGAEMVLVVHRPESDTGARPVKRESSRNILIALASVSVGAVVAGFAFTRRRRRGAKKEKAEPGEFPALAMPVSGPVDAAKVLANGHCACGAARTAFAITWTDLMFDGETIQAGRLICPGCGAVRVRYFKIG